MGSVDNPFNAMVVLYFFVCLIELCGCSCRISVDPYNQDLKEFRVCKNPQDPNNLKTISNPFRIPKIVEVH